MQDLSAEDLGEDTTGEALLVSGSIQTDIFAAAKLSREQMRARNKETLTALIENEEVAEEQREEAVVVNITDESVDVCVGATELNDSQVAQIQDIVERKTGIAAKNTVITLASELAASDGADEVEEATPTLNEKAEVSDGEGEQTGE